MTSEITEATTNPAAARIVLIPNPSASPGSCGVCGISEDEAGFVFPNLHFEFYGTLIFCSTCIAQMARLYGWMEPEQAAKIISRLHELEAEADILRQSLLHLETAVDELTNYRMLRNANPDIANSGHPSGASEPTEADGVVVSLTERLNESESEVSEPISEQESVGVPGDSSDDPGPIIGL